MSDQNPQEEVRLERAPEIDDGALLRIRQIRPVEKAASPIIDHNLELIDAAIALRPWYLGQAKRTPHELMSTLLDPNANNAANMLTTFVETVKRFKPGAFPGHCDAVRKLEFTTVQLIRTLMTLIDSPVLVDAVKRVGALSATLADPSNYLLPDHDLRQRIDSRLRQMLESFGEISNAFHARERERDLEIVFSKLPPEPATKEDVKAIVVDAAGSAADKIVSSTERAADKVVHAVEKGAAKVARTARKRMGRKPKTKIDVQEAVWNIHEREKKNVEVKNMGHGRAIRENEYFHAKNELKVYGIMSAEAYIDLLNKRTKRLSRATVSLLSRK